MIRTVTEDDYEAVYELTKKFYEESPYKDLNFNREKYGAFFYSCIENPQFYLGAVHEDTLEKEKKITGVISAVKTEFPYSDNTMTVELAWYVLPAYRKNTRQGLNLLSTYEYWSKNVAKADMCQIVHLNNLNLEKLYLRRGYTPCESAYLKRN